MSLKVITEMRQGFVNELEQVGKRLEQIAAALKQEEAHREQLKGAIFALDSSANRIKQAEQAVVNQPVQSAQTSEQPAASSSDAGQSTSSDQSSAAAAAPAANN